MTVDACVRREGDASILFDADAFPQVGTCWFEPDWWRAAGRLRMRQGGRAAIGFLDTSAGPLVLRHFRRGGALARLFGDRYLWLGLERSRGFREFRLLAALRAHGLPVPVPVAARCRRHGAVSYTADLLTRELPSAVTLAERVRAGQATRDDFAAVGALLARFHAAGVYHADLNAHNIVWSDEGMHLLDFDRGRLRRPARDWQQANLARLKRSLLKIDDAAVDFERARWTPLLEAYAAGGAAA
ncbi:MAG: 3-deoxy-D-manno-octulosonic acid kinase [Xanthomonadaceae bacterium]|nr:3-deoxy-D-manno-octulosonic acid kinase [Xanthomonadaceae bacterium]MDE1957925.1 3-deoxy-D-manno-octulosonic acid kinase [Xanthomonadaceae bacterium]MDE2178393.1 3-deoxy-D-manno-octulosonic acid kinase [Xanthomonadaceae bacterium]MDE2244808.1 3-deoxy-D-manno-octulosonic acid kinase [Xanthomonadaceae bacterium]